MNLSCTKETPKHSGKGVFQSHKLRQAFFSAHLSFLGRQKFEASAWSCNHLSSRKWLKLSGKPLPLVAAQQPGTWQALSLQQKLGNVTEQERQRRKVLTPGIRHILSPSTVCCPGGLHQRTEPSTPLAADNRSSTSGLNPTTHSALIMTCAKSIWNIQWKRGARQLPPQQQGRQAGRVLPTLHTPPNSSQGKQQLSLGLASFNKALPYGLCKIFRF